MLQPRCRGCLPFPRLRCWFFLAAVVSLCLDLYFFDGQMRQLPSAWLFQPSLKTVRPSLTALPFQAAEVPKALPRLVNSAPGSALGPTASACSLAAAFCALAHAGRSLRPRARVPGRGNFQVLRAEKEGCDSKSTAAAAESETVAATTASTVSKDVPHDYVEELEGKMHELAQAGDFKQAALLREELSAAQLDDEGHVLLANTEFYAAFTARSLKRMKAMWLQAPFVQCIHPYDGRSVGYSAICSSFQRLFDASTKKSCIQAEGVKVNLRGATATVTCTEQISVPQMPRPLRGLLATNIFRKVAGRWLLVHRHVSTLPGESDGGFGDDSDSMEMQLHMQMLQPVIRAAASVGGSQIIIKSLRAPQGFGDDDDDEDSPFGIAEAVHIHHDNDDELEGADEDEDDDIDEEEDEEIYVEEGNDEMEDAQNTVRALRKLEKSNRISQQAKIQLMADMIRNPGESMAERAYTLLLGTHVADDEQAAAWEDFACLIISEAKRLEAGKASGQSKKQVTQSQGKRPDKK
eukprot:TRINITY_DN5094_c0_g1_i1.p1 TRINITY_DN5094_c0_g1~~TRINITY_DN5094_c0_g1_i1.p1  ORF type:complete len:534 (+),score=144.98 TRINITY_DN5094_c0_g1_i1:40-1602(+)